MPGGGRRRTTRRRTKTRLPRQVGEGGEPAWMPTVLEEYASTKSSELGCERWRKAYALTTVALGRSGVPVAVARSYVLPYVRPRASRVAACFAGQHTRVEEDPQKRFASRVGLLDTVQGLTDFATACQFEVRTCAWSEDGSSLLAAGEREATVFNNDGVASASRSFGGYIDAIAFDGRRAVVACDRDEDDETAVICCDSELRTVSTDANDFKADVTAVALCSTTAFESSSESSSSQSQKQTPSSWVVLGDCQGKVMFFESGPDGSLGRERRARRVATRSAEISHIVAKSRLVVAATNGPAFLAVLDLGTMSLSTRPLEASIRPKSGTNRVSDDDDYPSDRVVVGLDVVCVSGEQGQHLVAVATCDGRISCFRADDLDAPIWTRDLGVVPASRSSDAVSFVSLGVAFGPPDDRLLAVGCRGRFCLLETHHGRLWAYHDLDDALLLDLAWRPVPRSSRRQHNPELGGATADNARSKNKRRRARRRRLSRTNSVGPQLHQNGG